MSLVFVDSHACLEIQLLIRFLSILRLNSWLLLLLLFDSLFEQSAKCYPVGNILKNKMNI